MGELQGYNDGLSFRSLLQLVGFPRVLSAFFRLLLSRDAPPILQGGRFVGLGQRVPGSTEALCFLAKHDESFCDGLHTGCTESSSVNIPEFSPISRARFIQRPRIKPSRRPHTLPSWLNCCRALLPIATGACFTLYFH